MDDLISRNAAIVQLSHNKIGDDDCDVIIQTDIETIKMLPSAEKRGEWIDNHNGTISCSRCRSWFHKDDRYSYMHHCPYCTAKMTECEVKPNE